MCFVWGRRRRGSLSSLIGSKCFFVGVSVIEQEVQAGAISSLQAHMIW